MSGALTRFRVMAYVTGVVLAVLFIWFLLVQVFHVVDKTPVYSFLWTCHGMLYVLYLVTVIDLASRVRFPVVRTLLVMLAGTVPFMSFVAEHYVTRDVRARLAGQTTPSAARSSATGSSSG